jgi:O-methyltransferase involved in polyketide biosynthesis
MPVNARQKTIPSSLLDYSWMDILKSGDSMGGLFFIAEGVLYYLDDEHVKDLLKKVAGFFPGSEMIFDAESKFGMKLANRMVIKKSGMDEKSFLKWSLARAF